MRIVQNLGLVRIMKLKRWYFHPFENHVYVPEGLCILFTIEERLEHRVKPEGEAVQLAGPRQGDELPVPDGTCFVQLGTRN